MTSAFGLEAYQRLARATVALIGAGGTGSAAIPILARAGVGRLIVIDGDHVTISNLERLHGSRPSDVEAATPKALVAKRSEERRVGKGCVSTGRSRWSPFY